MPNRYKNDWDRRAREDSRGYIASHDHETEEVFDSSGARTKEIIFGIADFQEEGSLDRVLEIGCGSGRILGHFGEDFKKLCGIDVSPEMLLLARERLAKKGITDALELLEVDGDGRIRTEEKFDLIYSWVVFQHIERKHTVAYFREIGRLLKETGVAVLQFAEPYGIRRNLQALFHIDPLRSDTFRFRYFRRAQVESLCRKNGLKVDKCLKEGVYRIVPVRPGSR